MSIAKLENVYYVITKNNDHSLEILQDISLTIHKGEFHLIVGPSGSGKTTLLQLLATFLHPTAGKRLLFGQSLPSSSNNNDLYKIRSRIGYLFQTPYLPSSLTIREYLELQGALSGVGLATIEERTTELLQQLNISYLMNKRPAKISGGEKQRVALAGLLIKKDVELLLLDEPTGSLDEEHSESIWSIVSEVNKQGITVASVTHDIAVKKYANKVYQLDYGTLKHT